MLYFPDKSDIPQLTELWELLFDDEREYIDFFMQKYFKKGHAIALKTDNKIIGVIYFFWGHIADNGKMIKTLFLYAGGIHPDYRKKGYMRKLVQLSFEHGREKGCEVCFGVSALHCIPLYETEGMKHCSCLDVIDISPMKSEIASMNISQIDKNMFISLRNEYLLSRKKALVWDNETSDFIYNELMYSGDILKITCDNTIYYATIETHDSHILIRETNLPLEKLNEAVTSISQYLNTTLPFKIYREVDENNRILFNQVESIYYGHGITLAGNYDFNKCYINLIAE